MKPKTPNNELILYRLDEIKSELADIKSNYVTKVESQALKHEIEELRSDVNDLKHKKTLRDTILWVGLTASAIINILALYNIFTRRP